MFRPSIEDEAGGREGKIRLPAPGSSLIVIQPHGLRPPLYLVHGVGGGMLWGYANLARHLGDDQPIYAITCRGSKGLPEYDTLQEMAVNYVRELREFQPVGPYLLGGYCFGGNVAFQMARLLDQQGQQVSMVVLMNSVPANCDYDRIRWTPVITTKFAVNLGYWFRQFLRWPAARQQQFLRWKYRSIKRRLAISFGAPPDHADYNADEMVDLLAVPNPEHRRIWAAHVRAFTRFRPEPFGGRVSVLRSRGHQMFSTFGHDYGWEEFALGGVAVEIVPGEHESILEEPHVAALARALRAQLESIHPNDHSIS